MGFETAWRYFMRRRVLGFLISAGCILLSFGCDVCNNRMVREIPSPNGSKRAVLFERDCGATTDFSTQVSILPVGKKLGTSAGNTFVADSNHGIVSVDSQSVIAVDIAWKNDQEIEITYPTRARTFLKASEFQGIRIVYRMN